MVKSGVAPPVHPVIQSCTFHPRPGPLVFVPLSHATLHRLLCSVLLFFCWTRVFCNIFSSHCPLRFPGTR